jgi:hypothetical protein
MSHGQTLSISRHANSNHVLGLIVDANHFG